MDRRTIHRHTGPRVAGMAATQTKTAPRVTWHAGSVTTITSYLHGIYPRSEALVAATRDAERGRGTASDVQQQRRADGLALEALQREAGLDYVSSGMLAWQDLFRPLVAACPGWATGPLRRWFGNNTFIRVPVIRGAVELDRDLLAAETGEVGTLPGPYTFSRVADTVLDPDRLIGALAGGVLRPAAEELVARGARVVHLQEPSLAAHGIDSDCWPPLAAAVRLVREGLDVPVVVHTYFGDATPWLGRLRTLPADAVGVDLTETDVAALAGRWHTGILAGCLDGRSSVLENAKATAALARRIIDIARPPVLMLSPSCDMELLPRALADRKTRVLGAAASLLREELGC
jgi:5-methyltetrahydropteroyltriglutamate--homocysteine methyltransferase